ncbi:NYN domain-containing protein [Falsiroseomonas bella]|nr:NYN domain-containing protein [Falsiroseomonas bella]
MRLAVLIDAENAQARLVASVLQAVDRHGRATLRRAYGDWSAPALSGWRDAVDTHAIEPIQQFRSRSGKNSSDCAMIVDAMDLLHGGRFDGFCLMSNDNDFASLARRIRREGRHVFGFGTRGAGEQLQQACDRYLMVDDAPRRIAAADDDAAMCRAEQVAVLAAAVEGCREASGWSPLTAVGQRAKQEGVTPAELGFSSLRKLLEAFAFFEISSAESGAGTRPNEFVRRIPASR